MDTSTTTTAKTNVQVIQQAFQDFLQGNIRGVIDSCDDSVEWGSYKNPEIPTARMFYGKEGVQEFFTAITNNIDYKVFDPREFIAQGDTVMVLGHHSGMVKKTGKSFDHDWCMHFKIKNEKVTYYFVFVDTLDQAKSFKE